MRELAIFESRRPLTMTREGDNCVTGQVAAASTAAGRREATALLA